MVLCADVCVFASACFMNLCEYLLCVCYKSIRIIPIIVSFFLTSSFSLHFMTLGYCEVMFNSNTRIQLSVWAYVSLHMRVCWICILIGWRSILVLTNRQLMYYFLYQSMKRNSSRAWTLFLSRQKEIVAINGMNIK